MNPHDRDESAPDLHPAPPDLSPTEREARVESVFGHFAQVTATPTWKPKTLKDCIAFDTTTGKVYYYDFTNNVWKSVGGSSSSYGGVVNADGSAGHLPTGWSSSLSVSTYTVTHNLNTSSYSAVVVINNDTAICSVVLTQNANTFTVSFNKNAGGSETTKVWNFVLIPIS